MSVARPLAQAVLGVALLGYVIRLAAAAVSDHQPAAVTQLAESFSVRFWHRDHPGALVTYCYYAALDLDDLTSISVERQAELLACTDREDPGGTEVWSDYRYETTESGFGSVEAATAAARRAAEAHLACDEDWSGRPPWDSQ